MPLFMDVHKQVNGATAKDVAEAHKKDLATQGKYGVRYLKYWLDEKNGRIYCLAEAPRRLCSRPSRRHRTRAERSRRSAAAARWRHGGAGRAAPATPR